MIARWIAGRVFLEIVRDRRTLVLIFVVPMLVMTMVYYVFSETETARMAVLSRGVARIFEADLVDALAASDGLEMLGLDVPDDEDDVAVLEDHVYESLRQQRLDGVLYISSSLLTERAGGERGTLHIYLEGSRPTVTSIILSGVAEAMDELANALPVVVDASCSDACADSFNTKPMDVSLHYLHGSEDLRWIDFILPVLPPFFIFFFTFVISAISFQRERARGTLERLMVAPMSFPQVVYGYIGGFVTFATIQAAIILSYFLFLIGIPLTLSQVLALAALMLILLVISLILGLLASFLAHNEFQAVQMVPLVMLPQVVFSDIIWPVESFHWSVRWISYLMPLTHANIAVREVLIKNMPLWTTWPQIAGLAAFFVACIVILARPGAARNEG